jgi:glutamate synthase (NADPH/NADH) small chain
MQSVSGESIKLDRKARMKLPPQELAYRPAQERVCDFDEVVIHLDAEQAMLEAARCIHCPDPAPCTKACPANNDIPAAMWLIEEGRFLEAAELYRQSSSMPEICGRVCPHDQLCQASCVRDKRGETVLTGALEVFVTEYQREHAEVTVEVGAPTGKKIAIVGAGPAGLACAEKLVQSGHAVTVFDSKPAPGGLLLYGIPNFKLPKEVVSARIADLERAGVSFVFNTVVGVDRSVDGLMEEGYEAVFLGVGTGVDASMDVPGDDLPGVYLATEFLIRGNVDPGFLPADMGLLPPLGENVVVVGGGDTASDCLRTALRLGARKVQCLYRRTEAEMPGNSHDRLLAEEEGAEFHYLIQPVRFLAGEDGRLSGVECLRTELGEPGKDGRRRPVPIEGSEFVVPADSAVLALGYWPDPTLGKTTPGLETHKWGLIITDSETGATSRPGVYAGGDAVTGPDLVVTAMAAGRRAAAAIDGYLTA